MEMPTKCSADKECCTDVLNLPEEMAATMERLGGLEGLRSRVPGRENVSEEAKLFQSLSDPIRLQILHALQIADLCPCILKEITALSDSKLSYHLSVLEEAKLVTWSSRKKWRIYMLSELGLSIVERLARPRE